MKQTKTTLILGVLLAIIVIVLVSFEIKNNIESEEDANIENASVLPTAKKISKKVLPILQSVNKTLFIGTFKSED